MSGNPSTSSTGGGGGGGGGGGPCGACKFLRRKCVAECIFAPYFDSEQGSSHFAAVHKVFGASNVTKLLMHIPVNKRLDAVITICYEAQARLKDPVYGCVSQIFALQQQVTNLQTELSYFQAHLATLEAVSPPPQPPPPPPSPPPPPPELQFTRARLSISDLPTTTCIPTAYDLSSLFEPPLMKPSSWNTQQMPSHQFNSGNTIAPAMADMPPPHTEGTFIAVPCSSGTSLSPHGRGDEIV